VQIGKPWDVPTNGITIELESPNNPSTLFRFDLMEKWLSVNRCNYMSGDHSIIIGFQQ
jgi:hypothetical protein